MGTDVLRDHRPPVQIVKEEQLLNEIAKKAGIARSRLSIPEIHLDPEEYHVDRRLRLDGRRVKIRWWQPGMLEDQSEVDMYARELLEELAWREEGNVI